MRSLTIGTRGSALARWQAQHVAEQLIELAPGLNIEIQIIKTKGDKILDVPLAKVGGKGLFVKEIEEALQAGRVDLAVHSMKDVPAEAVEGLGLAAILAREDPRDALVSERLGLLELPLGARVGTSSLRRRCQLMKHRPDLQILDLRGNVDTRLRKLSEGQFDAVILAAAGLKRLGFGQRITEVLATELMLPAVGQGALGIETRVDDGELNDLLQGMHHAESGHRVQAERAMLARLEGGCQVPIAGFARIQGDRLTLEGLIGHPSGSPMLQESIEGPRSDAEELGYQVADRLLRRGARRIMQEVAG